MTIEIEPIQEDFDREIHWTRLILTKSNLNTTILACITQNYLYDHYEVGSGDEKLKSWESEIRSKWQQLNQTLDDDFYALKYHYDIYTNTKKGEANCINFLISKVES